jgi:hypothetical protein
MACPVCRAALRAWSAKGIVIDRCDAHGVWFDRSELDQLVASAHGRGETRDGVGVGLAVGGVAVGTVATVAAMQSPSSTSERVDTGIEAVGTIADGLPLVDAAPEIAAGAGEAASAVLEGGAEAAGGVFEAIGAIFDIFS